MLLCPQPFSHVAPEGLSGDNKDFLNRIIIQQKIFTINKTSSSLDSDTQKLEWRWETPNTKPGSSMPGGFWGKKCNPLPVPDVEISTIGTSCANRWLIPQVSQSQLSQLSVGVFQTTALTFVSFFCITEKDQVKGSKVTAVLSQTLQACSSHVDRGSRPLVSWFSHRLPGHFVTPPILYFMSGRVNNNELAYVKTSISDWVIQSGIRRKDGLQRWHSMKSNGLLYTQTPRLRLGQLPSSSIINDRGTTGVNWYPVCPSIYPSIPHARSSCGRVDRLHWGYRT